MPAAWRRCISPKTSPTSLVHYPYYAQHCPFLEGVRADPGFQQLMGEVKPRWEALVEWERGLASVPS